MIHRETTDRRAAGRFALLAAALLWGTSFVILKNTLESVGTLWILAVRFTLAALLLGFFAGKRLARLSRRERKGGVLLGLCLAAAYITQTYGLKYTTPGKNAFLTAVYCVLVPFLAWGVYRRKPMLRHVLAALLCLVGIGFVSLSDLESGLNRGDMLTLFCGVFYALQIVIVEHYGGEGGDALSLSAVQFAVAALVCWAGALPLEPVPVGVPVGAWLNIAYMGFVCTGLCFFLEAWGMKYTPSSTAAVLLTLESVFGTLTSVIFYHEQLTAKLLIGFALIFFSVLLSETGLELIIRHNE